MYQKILERFSGDTPEIIPDRISRETYVGIPEETPKEILGESFVEKDS